MDYCGNKFSSTFGQIYTVFYKKKDYIILPGDEGKWIYCLKKGLIRCYIVSSEGEESILMILSPSSLFPASKIFNNTQNKHIYYQALTDIETIRCPKKEFLKLIMGDEKMIMGVLGQISERVNTLIERWQHRTFGNIYSKITTTLMYLVSEFGDKTEGSKYIIKHWFTHQDIALIAGVSRERASLVLKELKEEGVISYEKRFIKINNMEELEFFS